VGTERHVSDQLRKRQIAGLLILLGIVVAAGIYRAGITQVFPRGWWHVW
jgi:hypothetical protein